MKKLLQSLALFAGLLFLPSLAHATGLEDCSPLQNGYIRDGFTPACGQLLKVNPDGSINILGTITPGAVLTTTNRDTSIIVGGTAQNVMAVNTARRVFYIFNPDASEVAWCSFSTTALANGQGSFPIYALGGFGMEQNAPTTALSCVAATTAHKLTAWESQ